MEGARNAWVDELSRVLWAYKTTSQIATAESPFSITYRTDVVVLAKIVEPSFRVAHFDYLLNDQGLALNLDLNEIKRDMAYSSKWWLTNKLLLSLIIP